MKRLLVALSHPRVLLLGTVFAVGIAVQVWLRGQGASLAYLAAGIFLFACLGAGVAAWSLYRRGL